MTRHALVIRHPYIEKSDSKKNCVDRGPFTKVAVDVIIPCFVTPSSAAAIIKKLEADESINIVNHQSWLKSVRISKHAFMIMHPDDIRDSDYEDCVEEHRPLSRVDVIIPADMAPSSRAYIIKTLEGDESINIVDHDYCVPEEEDLEAHVYMIVAISAILCATAGIISIIEDVKSGWS